MKLDELTEEMSVSRVPWTDLNFGVLWKKKNEQGKEKAPHREDGEGIAGFWGKASSLGCPVSQEKAEPRGPNDTGACAKGRYVQRTGRMH